jgi:hypothetical protein
LLLILALPVAAQDAASQIKVEIQRLQQSLKDRPFSDPDLPDVNSMVGGELKAANDALNAGRLYLGLERLAGAEDLLQGARVVADKKAETVKGGLPAYEEEWKKVGTSLNAQGREVVTRDWRSAPAAQRALSETAQGRAVPLLEGGRGFATSMQPKDGLFYIGQAQGEAAFARFCGSLRLPRQGSPSLRRSLLRELQALQEKTNAAFVPPRSIDLHSRFIALNSTLKLAQELDAAMSYSGALYQYLEAVRHWGMLDVAAPDAAAQSKLKEAVAAMGKKIDASASDDSIAKLFIERAASQVAHADGSAPSADEWKSAQVILDQVLPAYFDAQKKTVARISVTSGKTVEITLVRWPYT